MFAFTESFLFIHNNIIVLYICFVVHRQTDAWHYQKCVSEHKMPRESLLVIDNAELRHDRAATLRRVHEHAGLPWENIADHSADEVQTLLNRVWPRPVKPLNYDHARITISLNSNCVAMRFLHRHQRCRD